MDLLSEKTNIREWTASLVESYFVITSLTPAEAYKKYGFWLNPSETKIIDGIKNYRVIYPGNPPEEGGWAATYNTSSDEVTKDSETAPVDSSPMPTEVPESYDDISEAPIQSFTDVTDELGAAKRGVVKTAKWAVDPERRYQSKMQALTRKQYKLGTKAKKHGYISDIHAMKQRGYLLRKDLAPSYDEGYERSFQVNPDDSKSFSSKKQELDYIKHLENQRKLQHKMDSLRSKAQYIQGRKQYLQNYGLRSIPRYSGKIIERD